MSNSGEKEGQGIKLWLDDVREAPEGWKWVKTADEAIEVLQTSQVTEISLDHDLGENVPTGYMVALWIEEESFEGWVHPPLKWTVHSANPVGRRKMRQALEYAEACWERYK